MDTYFCTMRFLCTSFLLPKSPTPLKFPFYIHFELTPYHQVRARKVSMTYIISGKLIWLWPLWCHSLHRDLVIPVVSKTEKFSFILCLLFQMNEIFLGGFNMSRLPAQFVGWHRLFYCCIIFCWCHQTFNSRVDFTIPLKEAHFCSMHWNMLGGMQSSCSWDVRIVIKCNF